jgi:hypothetical protein
MRQIVFVSLLCVGPMLPQCALGQTNSVVPNFSGFWAHGVEQIVFSPDPEAEAGPVIDVLNMECTPNCPPRPSGQAFIGDPTNPNLTPAAAEAVQNMGDRWRSGEIVNVATELCGLSGVPHVLTLFGLVQFLQEDDQVTIVYERDHQVRRIYLNQGHTRNPKPDWYGESVGHYEGDTLVVDTIGLGGDSLIDRFGVPQTIETHVVERFRIDESGNALRVHVTVSDPSMFYRPWSGSITYSRRPNAASITETRCAENNRDAATGEDYPIPTAASADF